MAKVQTVFFPSQSQFMKMTFLISLPIFWLTIILIKMRKLLMALVREQKGVNVESIDELVYGYTGNQLLNVHDESFTDAGFKDGNTGSGQEYFYDANGNMIQDGNKGISSIIYNHLNLPSKIIMDDGRFIEYIYDAAGIKLAQVVHDGDSVITEYDGEFIYSTKNDTTAIELIHHDEGRIVQNEFTDEWVYQYHIKDHLGNVRTTFTTQPDSVQFTINFEELGNDDMNFAQVNPSSIISNDIFDHTDATGTVYSQAQMLNGTDSLRIGAVIAISIGKGDTLNASVWGKYVDITSTPTNAIGTLASALIGAFTGSGAATSPDGGVATINNNFGSGSVIGPSGFPLENSSAPRAFLNLMFLPANDTIYLESGVSFAYDQIDINATQPLGQSKNQNFDQMAVDLIAPDNGYILVYVSNESNYLSEVYFDDMELTINSTAIIQSDDYYPFGLTFNSYQRVTSKQNDYLYNGKELQDELDLNWLDYGARMYMPDIGRFSTIDPLSYNYDNQGVYNYAFNNPIKYTDYLGLGPNDEVECPDCDWAATETTISTKERKSNTS
jgi:RHS repeat-associated protein